MHKNKIKQQCETFNQHGRNKIRKRVILPLVSSILFLSLVTRFSFGSSSISVSPYIFALCAFFDCMQCFFLIALVISTHCTYSFFPLRSRALASHALAIITLFYSVRIYFLRNNESCLSLISELKLISQSEISLLARVRIM